MSDPVLKERIIKVRVETHYGRTSVYPVCETSSLFARLSKTKTLTSECLNYIKDLGFAIEVVVPELPNLKEKK